MFIVFFCFFLFSFSVRIGTFETGKSKNIDEKKEQKKSEEHRLKGTTHYNSASLQFCSGSSVGVGF